jgi:uncharacterized protein
MSTITENKDGLLKYLIYGMMFGIVLIKAEVISWWRIQEMFKLDSFHMYGVIGSAVITGAISIFLIKKFEIKSSDNKEPSIEAKPYNKGTIIGGLMFGLGWAITGACPGPIYALIGSGYLSYIVVLIGALMGVYTYGAIKDKLPH